MRLFLTIGKQMCCFLVVCGGAIRKTTYMLFLGVLKSVAYVVESSQLSIEFSDEYYAANNRLASNIISFRL